MASLKEIKLRIASVTSTEKITSAMKVVSSAKLHHAESESERTLAYVQKLESIQEALLNSDETVPSPYLNEREVHTVAIVSFSSSSGLCGAFNSNVLKETISSISSYKEKNISVKLFPIGKKVASGLKKAGFDIVYDYIHIGEHPTFAPAEKLASELMKQFCEEKIDRVQLIYHHFKNRGVQILTNRCYLPVTLPEAKEDAVQTDFILEPKATEMQTLLIPQLLHLDIFTTLSDTTTAEHAARILAMQTANDNANDLLDELSLLYNKTRQQSITNELLDIVNGVKR